jgi:MFS family permease
VPAASSERSSAQFTQLLRRPGYPGFLVTVGLSRVSGGMFITAGVLFVLARTGSPALAGATSAAATLPAALTGPLLGAWIDVAASRRALIVIDQLASVVALVALLALAGHAPNWTIPAVAVLYSVTRPLSTGSYFSALAEIAGPELLEPAGTIESASLNLSIVLGPALAGVLAGVTSAATVLAVQAGATLVVAGLIAANPAFEARPADLAPTRRTRRAMAAGLSALWQERTLRAASLTSLLAAFGWGMMSVGFPLYARQVLHAGAHTSGYMWAAVAGGSLVGTFALAGLATLRRMGLSYLALGLSALLWPLAHVLVLGVALIGLTGFLEGPAYSGTMVLRQRHAPPAVRGQVSTTLTSINLAAMSAGAGLAGAVAHATPLIFVFVGVNLVAALTAVRA